ncbi:MAG: hypothetical protein NVSMB62_24610 [Acidobacteriaceae bacterium]
MRSATETIRTAMGANAVKGGWMMQPEMPVFANGTTFDEVRWAKVDALRREIAAGTYFVPAALVAEKLVRRITGMCCRVC